MTDDRVLWHLWNWSVHARGVSVDERDYGSRASGGIGHSHSNDSESMVAEVDSRCAYAVDVIVADLPLAERLAVRHVHLEEAVYSIRGGFEEPYARAKLAIGRGLDRRGIM